MGKLFSRRSPKQLIKFTTGMNYLRAQTPVPACCRVWGWDRWIFAYKTLSGLAPKKLVFGYAVNGEICLEKVSLAKFSAVGCQVWTRCLHDKFIFHIWFTFCEVGTARKCNMQFFRKVARYVLFNGTFVLNHFLLIKWIYLYLWIMLVRDVQMFIQKTINSVLNYAWQ